MAKKGNLYTVAQNHSVKEAAIIFTLSSRISSVDSYRDLLSERNDISKDFQKFEPVSYRDIKIAPQIDQTNVIAIKDKGFKMIAFEEGSTSKIIQLIPQSRRSILTFNTVKYTNWNNFIDNTLKYARCLSNVDNSLMLASIGVMFIDEFFFEGEHNYVPTELFNENSDNLPKSVCKTDIVDYSLNTHNNGDENNDYIENINIRVFNQAGNKVIRIIGNTMMFIPPLLFRKAVEKNDLVDKLSLGHEKNKNMLKDILNHSVVELIGL